MRLDLPGRTLACPGLLGFASPGYARLPKCARGCAGPSRCIHRAVFAILLLFGERLFSMNRGVRKGAV